VTALPADGVLKNSGTALLVGDTFTQDDISFGYITYEHSGAENPTDSFQFDLSDGNGGEILGQTFTLNLNPINDIPTLDANTGVTVVEGDSVIITSAHLGASDGDGDPLVYTLDTVPVSGELYNAGVLINVGQTFTQADIDAGLISYVSDGSEVTSDSFGFSITDGNGGSISAQSFNITVSATNDAPEILSVPISSGVAFDTAGGTKHIYAETQATSALDNFTLETMFNWDGTRDTTGNLQTLILNGDGSTNGYAVSLDVDDTGTDSIVVDYFGVDQFKFDIGTMSSAMWKHVAVVREAGTLKVYLDGQELTNFTTTSTLDDLTAAPNDPTGGYFAVGTLTPSSGNFKGQLEELRVWETARSQSEIEGNIGWTLPSDETSMVVRYSFDGAISSVIRDRALADGTEFNGTVFSNTDGSIKDFSYVYSSPVLDELHTDVNDGVEHVEAGLFIDQVEFADPDTSTPHTVTISATNGVLDYGGMTLSNGTISGDGTASVTLSGYIADINTFLSNSYLRYLPDVRFEGSAEITINISDGTNSTQRILPVAVGNLEDGVTINGTVGADMLTGTFGDDVILGGDGDDVINGDFGDDYFKGGAGLDTITGGDGYDTVDYADEIAGLTADLTLGLNNITANSGADTVSGIENLVATNFVDTISGTSESETFHGLAGADVIDGVGGGDAVAYYKDADHGGSQGILANLSGTQFVDGATTIAANSAVDGFGDVDSLTNIDKVYGTSSNDYIVGNDFDNRFRGFDGADTFVGGAGYDTLDYAVDVKFGAVNGVTVDLSAGTATDSFGNTDTFSGMEMVRASQLDDVLYGGGSGTDFEQFQGMAGNDTIYGNGSAFAEVSYDHEHYFGGIGGIVVNVGAGTTLSVANYTVTDSFGNTDTLNAIDRIRGTMFNDTFIGGDYERDRFRDTGGDDYFDGGAGGKDEIDYSYMQSGVTVDLSNTSAQFISAEAGTDTLINVERVRGTDYDDTIIGSAVSNFLRGNSGSDTLTGGSGADYFYFYNPTDSYYVTNVDNKVDVITDFVDGEDKFLFEGMSGYEYDATSFGEFADVDSFLTAVSAESDGKVFFFTVGGTDGYVYVKGSSSAGTDYSNTLVKLAGVTTPVSLSSFDGGVGAPNLAPHFMGVETQSYAVEFDGQDNHVVIGAGNADSLQIDGDMTIESWLRPTDLSKQNVVLQMMGAGGDGVSGDNILYGLQIEPGGDLTYYHEYGTGTDFQVTFDANLTQGAWAQVSLVRDDVNGEVKLFVNGVEATALSGTHASPFNLYDPSTEGPTDGANGVLVAGAYTPDANTGTNYAGDMAEVRIWSEARTETEIVDNHDRVLNNPAGEATLQGYWRFDEIGDDQEFVRDYSVNGNNIRTFDSLSFDGIDDYVETNMSVDLGDHSAAAWINTTTSTTGTVLSGNNASGQTFDMSVDGSGQLVVTIVGDTGFTKTYTTSGLTLNDGAWHNIGYSFSIGGGLSLYADGVQISAGLTQSPDDAITLFNATTSLTIGQASDDTAPFEGKISDVSLFKGEIGVADFTTLYDFGADSVAAEKLGHWRFDDASGSIVENDDFNSMLGDATIYGMTFGSETWNNVTPNINGYAQTSLRLDTAGTIDLGTINPANGDMTVSAWINPDDIETGTQEILSLGSAFSLQLTASGHIELSLDNANHILVSDFWEDDGGWSHVAATYNATTGEAAIYIDGEHASSYNIGVFDISGTAHASSIGAGFAGRVGEVQLWDRELTPAELESYAFGGLTGGETDLIGYWPMTDGSGSVVSDMTGNHTGTLTSGYTWQPELPTLLSDTVEVTEDQVFFSHIVTEDAEGDVVSYSLLTQATNGTVVLNGDGSFSYTPNTNVTGADSFVVTISDDQGNSYDQTFNVNITPHNEEPDAVYDQFTVALDTPITISQADLIANDTDQDGHALTVVSVNGGYNGTLVDNGDNTWTYTPDTGFNGMDSLQYTLSDGQGGIDYGYVDLAVGDVFNFVEGTSGDDILSGTAGNDFFDGLEGADEMTGNGGSDEFFFASSVDTNVTDTDTIFDFITGDDKISLGEAAGYTFNLGYAYDTDVSTTIVNINSDAGVADQTIVTFSDGTDSYVFIKDSVGSYNNFLLRLANNETLVTTDFYLINSSNTPPVASDDTISTAQDTIANFDLLANDTDGEGDVLTITHIDGTAITVGGTVGVTDGSVTLNVNGSIDFDPTPGFNGTTSFTYTVSDGQGGVDTAVTSVDVGTGSPTIEYIGSEFGDPMVGTISDELFEGLEGEDTLTGSGGADIFVYNGSQDSNTVVADTITDFNANADDMIELIGADGYTFSLGYATGVVDPSATITDIETNGTDQTIYSFDDGVDTYIYIKDASGTYSAIQNEFGAGALIVLNGVHALDSADFALVPAPIPQAGTVAGETLTGGTEDNIFIPGDGADTMTGGGGHDEYVFYGAVDSDTAEQDIITDFDPLTDTLTLMGAEDLFYHGQFAPTSATTVSGIIAEIDADGAIADQSVVTFTESTNTYVYVKASNTLDPYHQFLLVLNNTPALTVDSFHMESFDNTLLGTTGADTAFATTDLDDVVDAGDGDDSVSGYGGDDIIIGGNGTDSVGYIGSSVDFTISQTGAEVEIIDNNFADGNEGTDVLIGVENIGFSTGTTTGISISQASDMLVNTTTANDQLYSDVAGLYDGGHVVVWEGVNATTPTTTEVYMRLIGEDGTDSGEVVVRANASTTITGSARVTALMHGGYIVTWVENGSGTQDIMAAAYSYDGTPDSTWGANPFVIANSGNEESVPAITSTDDGGFIVAWTDSGVGNGDILANRYYGDGSGPTAISVPSNASNAETGVEVVGLSGGGYAISWQEITPTGVDLKFAVYDEIDTTSGAVTVATDITNVTSDAYGMSVLYNGEIALSWTSDEDGDGKPEAMIAVYNPNGTIYLAPMVVNPEDAVIESSVDVTALQNGNLVVVWRAEGLDQNSGGIFAKIIDPSTGMDVTDMFLINQDTAGDQSLPRVDTVKDWDSGGGFVVTWTGQDGLGSQGVYKQTYNNDGTIMGGLTLAGTAGDDTINAGDGTQYLAGDDGNDVLYGGAGEDFFNAGAGTDSYIGGDGTTDLAKDSVSYAQATAAVNVDLAAGTASASFSTGAGTHTFNGIDAVEGSDFGDTINGSVNTDFIDGGLGADTITAGDGDDFIVASVGGDAIHGGLGYDWITFDTGIATEGVTFSMSIIGDTVNTGGDANDQNISTDFGWMDIAGIDNAEGTEFADTLTGDTNTPNTLYGLEGADILDGLGGNDVLVGGMDSDNLTGGAGNDIFHYEDMGDIMDSSTMANAADIITDFLSGTDQLSFHKYGFDNMDQLLDGPLSASNFETTTTVPTEASTAAGTPTFIFLDDGVTDAQNTALYYDADGSDSGYQATKIAEFSDDATITKDDILITSS